MSRRQPREIDSKAGVPVLGFAADVTDGKAIDSMLDEVRSKWGAPEILVNNSGGPPPGNFQDTPEEAWDAAHKLTLSAAVSLTAKFSLR